jgi:uncharacterized membrane protein
MWSKVQMRIVCLASLSAAAVASLYISAATAGVLVRIPTVPGSTATYAMDINNNNVIAGRYTTADGHTHGFFGTLDGNYKTFDVPSEDISVVRLNDANYIVGTTDRNSDCPWAGCDFVRKPDGTIESILKHGTPVDGVTGSVLDDKSFIGDRRFTDKTGAFHLVGYYGLRTKYVSEMNLPASLYWPRPRGLVPDGTVAGWFTDHGDRGNGKGFVLKEGAVTVYQYPDQSAFNTQFEGISRKGVITGAWLDQQQSFSRPFIFRLSTGRFQPIDVPGAKFSEANGINDAGVVAVGSDTSSYIYCPRKKTCPLRNANAITVAERWIPAHGSPLARVHHWSEIGPAPSSSAETRSAKKTPRSPTRSPVGVRELALPI